MRMGFFPQILDSRSIDLHKRGSFLDRIDQCGPDFLGHPQFENVMLFCQQIKVEIDLESREKFCSLVLAKPFIDLLHETMSGKSGCSSVNLYSRARTCFMIKVVMTAAEPRSIWSYRNAVRTSRVSTSRSLKVYKSAQSADFAAFAALSAAAFALSSDCCSGSTFSRVV